MYSAQAHNICTHAHTNIYIYIYIRTHNEHTHVHQIPVVSAFFHQKYPRYIKKYVSTAFPVLYSGGSVRSESEYFFDLVLEAAKNDEDDRTRFHYHIGPVPVCRDAFCIMLGIATNNARFAKYESMVRDGVRELPKYKVGERAALQKQAVAAQYVASHVLIHSEKSPVDKILWLERQSVPEVFKAYVAHLQNNFCVQQSTFRKIWYKGLRAQIPDPASGELYSVKKRKRRAVGFKKCDVCSELEFAVMMAKNKNDRLTAKNRLHAHLQKVVFNKSPTQPPTHSTTPLTHSLLQVKANRSGLQAARAACNGSTIVGFTIDAADIGKFQTPVTKSTAKILGGMQRIKNKITGVEFFSGDRKILLFRTLPNITTGANLTLTILTRQTH